MIAITNILVKIRRFFNYTLDFYVYLILFLVFLVTAYPFWYILVYSVSDPLKIRSGFMFLPKGFSLEAYRSVFSNLVVLKAFFVSVLRSISGPLLSTTVSLLVAYGLSRKDLPGRKAITWYFIITMYFGAGLIPTYVLMKALKLVGSFWIYILPGMMNVFGMILMRTYIESLPEELHDSAYIDGANELVIFFKIIAPLCIPVIAAIALLSCVGHWNSYTDTLIYNSLKKELHTLQYVLVQFVHSISARESSTSIDEMIAHSDRITLTPMVVRMAITIITVLPISMVYPFMQRYFIKGIMIGAVKG